MKLYQLIKHLNQLPIDNMDVDVMIDTGRGSKTEEINIELVFEDGKITGVVITEDKQLRLPF